MGTDSKDHMTPKWFNIGEKYDPTNDTPQFDFNAALHNLASMAADHGYLIIRNAIPENRALELGRCVHEALEPMDKSKKMLLYHLSPEAVNIFSELVQSRKGDLDQLLNGAGLAKNSGGFGIICATVPESKPRYTSTADQVCFTVALNKLEEESGWYTMLEGSHMLGSTPEKDWIKVKHKLSPGDAVVFFAKLKMEESAGGGGKFMNMTYNILR